MEKNGTKKLVFELHHGPIDGHFSIDITKHKAIKDIFYSPTLFKGMHPHVRKFQIFQMCIGKENKETIPLQPNSIDIPFDEIGSNIGD